MSAASHTLTSAQTEIDRACTEVEAATGVKCLTDDELDRTRRDFIAQLDPNADLWIFGYGSLMWNPSFTHIEAKRGSLNGYSRSFCIKLVSWRGSVEKPGLMLAIHEGGSCEGIVFRIKREVFESDFKHLWAREMISSIYEAKLLPVHMEDNIQPALVFVANQNSFRYCCHPADEAAAMIAVAESQVGTNREYLYQLADKLREHSIQDEMVTDLYARVRALAND